MMGDWVDDGWMRLTGRVEVIKLPIERLVVGRRGIYKDY
jgi:hypothetical protein